MLSDTSPDTDLPAALDRVAAALAAMGAGDPQPYQACWSDSGDVTLFGAWGPIERGPDALAATFDWVGRRFSGGALVPEYEVVDVSGDLAYTVGFERGHVSVDRGPPRPMTIRVTHVFRRSAGEWRSCTATPTSLPPTSAAEWQAVAMGAIEDRLTGLGLQLPAPVSAPPGVRLPFDFVRVDGDVAYVSGHGSLDGDRVLYRGRVGAEVTLEEGYAAARATALSMLASLKLQLGELDHVSRWLKVLGFVRCAEGFDATPAVINGFSDLILELWGDAGRHARSAIGADQLPFGMPVEVEAVVALA